MNTNVMFSSATDLWATPRDFFDKLNAEFNFTLDPCATAENAKCEKFYTVVENGLKQNWEGGDRVLQPPVRESDKRMGKEVLHRIAKA